MSGYTPATPAEVETYRAYQLASAAADAAFRIGWTLAMNADRDEVKGYGEFAAALVRRDATEAAALYGHLEQVRETAREAWLHFSI